MRHLFRVSFCFLALLIAQPLYAKTPTFPFEEQPSPKLHVGEKLTYKISYLGLKVGEAVSEIKEITMINGREAYHIEVRVRSHPVIDLVYKVRDVHHSYIDVEHLHSLRYEKILREGRYRADEVMTYDQENHTAHYLSRRNGTEKEMFIPKNVQDQLSCGFYFRTLNFGEEETVSIPVNADEKNWVLKVELKKKDKMKIRGVGRFEVLKAYPKIEFEGLFVKKGRITGWVSMDKRRIPVKMKVKVPILGSVVVKLKAYEPGIEGS